MRPLIELIKNHRAAWDAWCAEDDDATKERLDEINMQVDFASHALLKHRPANLAEVTVKAAYMASNNCFTDWEAFDRKALIEAFLVVGDLTSPSDTREIHEARS